MQGVAAAYMHVLARQRAVSVKQIQAEVHKMLLLLISALKGEGLTRFTGQHHDTITSCTRCMVGPFIRAAVWPVWPAAHWPYRPKGPSWHCLLLAHSCLHSMRA